MIRAIQTRFDGRFFRSRLEARWAVLFKFLNVEYVHEPEGFILEDGKTYLPDFFLPNVFYRQTKVQGWHVEVKPKGTYNEKLDEICARLGIPGILLAGQNVRAGNHIELGTYRDDSMNFRQCVECSAVKINYGHISPICPACGGYACDAKVLEAVDAANSARFESTKPARRNQKKVTI